MRYFIAFTGLLAMLAFTLPVQAAEQKIAVVDIEKLLNESKAGKSISQQIETKQQAFQKEFSQKEKDLSDAQKKLIEEKKTITAEDFAKKRKEFEEKLIETRKLFQKRRTDMDRALGEAMVALRKNIIETAAGVAEKENYDILLTRDSVVIVDKTLDITDQVLKDLDTKIDNIKLSL